MSSNPYLDLYHRELRHQREHGATSASGRVFPDDAEHPSEYCLSCLRDGKFPNGRSHDFKRRFSWAIPDEGAIALIAQLSPRGVVEIGAGGGYWAMVLREFGVDVIAYDPEPQANDWHDESWSDVLMGDHTAVIGHPDRALLMCWPCYGGAWAAEALRLYDGDTVIYIGEGSGGCTADDHFHALLGEETWTDDPMPEPRFEEIAGHAIPRWWGLHDRLTAYRRLESSAASRTEDTA